MGQPPGGALEEGTGGGGREDRRVKVGVDGLEGTGEDDSGDTDARGEKGGDMESFLAEASQERFSVAAVDIGGGRDALALDTTDCTVDAETLPVVVAAAAADDAETLPFSAGAAADDAISGGGGGGGGRR